MSSQGQLGNETRPMMIKQWRLCTGHQMTLTPDPVLLSFLFHFISYLNCCTCTSAVMGCALCGLWRTSSNHRLEVRRYWLYIIFFISSIMAHSVYCQESKMGRLILYCMTKCTLCKISILGELIIAWFTGKRFRYANSKSPHS